ncbi:hypothetical protein KEM48_009650 [Puccinia striiformis f. sp. tritici PST-130]|nr:hypothetical protein KEM48_009650 [Puccinia striiformis f. sp. tritici PST-130]
MIGLLLHLLKFSPVSLDPRSLWDNAVSFKQKERLDRLARILNDSDDFSQINAFDLTVLSTPAHEIVARIGARRLNWNARNVTKAFIKAAIQAHVETNCLTEIMFEEALERADQMDKEFAATGQLKGRLHGIPVSLKDQVNVKGFDSTIGFTNSGGEAALLASDGSCLGIGGKSANSGALLRVLQPETEVSSRYEIVYIQCSGRIVQDGFRDCDDGYTEILGVIGPMARCWEDLVLLSQVMLHKPDPTTSLSAPSLPSGIKQQADYRAPMICQFDIDDLIETSSPCRRAVEETVDALKLAGYDCVEIDVSRLDVLEGLILYVGLSSADGYKTGLSHLGRDPIDDSMFLTTIGCMLPSWLRWIVCGITRYLLQDDVMAKLIEASQEKSTGELQKWRVRKDAYCLKLWEELGLDGLICPTQTVPAVPIGSSWNKSFLAESTLIWNLVDSTVGHIPITRVDIQRDQIRSDANSMTNAPKRSGDMWRVKDLLPSVEETEGLPVGIQLVCGFLEEEKTLALMGIIVKSWNNRPKQTAPLPKPGDFLGKKQGLGVAKSHP